MKKSFMIIMFAIIIFVAPIFIESFDEYKKPSVNDYSSNDYNNIGNRYVNDVREGLNTISWISDIGNVVIKLSSGVEAIKETASNIWDNITSTIASWFEGGWFS